MESKSHAAISLVVAAGALALTTPPVPAWAVVAVALGAGVGVDVDHFLIARYRTGNWEATMRCLRDPRIVFLDQSRIFRPGEVGSLPRLLSHAVIAGAAVPALWVWRPYVAGLVAAALYAHVLADLVAGTRESVVVKRESISEQTERARLEGDALSATESERAGSGAVDADADSGTPDPHD